MFKPHYHLAAVLLCFVFTTAQVVPNAEIGRITIQVPLLSNGKPVILTNQEREEVATVEEIKPGKVHVVQEVVVPPTVKSDNKVRVTRSVSDSGIPNHGIPNPGIPNHGIPNPGIPNHGIPNRGIPNDGIPNPGIPNHGIPNPGIPNHGIPNRGIPNDGIPNPGIPNHGIPNPGIPNHGIPNRGIPNDGIPNPGIPNHGIPNPGIPNHGIPNPGIPNHGIPNPGIPIPDASEHKPVVVMPSSRTTSAPASTSMPKRVPSRNCFHLLMGGMTTTSPVDMMTPPSTENCDELCTKFEYSPICAFNGICIHEFANQCVMNTFNCKHRDLSFRAVDEDVCRLGVCMRRCKAEELVL
ncbi:RNA-binding protein 12 isoform X1 [Drosophila mauritiana]|uniref:RNA-binding protein 12 isoform X1 n=1 Tax=Drosophila mauritiana TaxID=7226 RepID=A0A6P8JXQ9_DROMA|nr:RNA-binding protein 12 isoform X1 [Drosophila mauritiana]